MSDDNQLVTCPSCAHENAQNVDKCVICDFPLARHMNQSQTRSMTQSPIIDAQQIARTNKKLGPLPDSDMLIDKRKTTQGTSHQILECPKCGVKSHMGTVRCDNCGERLDSIAPLAQLDSVNDDTQDATPFFLNERDTDTQLVQNLDIFRKHATELPAVAPEILSESTEGIPQGCVKFTSWMILQLGIMGYNTPIIVHPIEDKPLLIGRRHKSLPIQPHIDLTPYLTEKHGVSRRHALLRLRGTRLELQDLKSTNGTGINGTRFSPKESHQLRHQDIIQVGQIQMQVSFIRQVHSAKTGYTEELT